MACFLSKSTNITCIEQKYFETGHSQSECDSMHSCVEKRLKCRSIYEPSDYTSVLKRAVNVKPYNVYELSHRDMMNFEKINVDCIKNAAFNGIQSIHHILYVKDEHGLVKISFAKEIGVDLTEKCYMRKQSQSLNTVSIPAAYSETLFIDKDKNQIF
jgi:hypothetical protein